ncbi:MAG: hypothetical protein K6G03_09140 [Lachnospiraceae bacterium]|nr:hypothetical protein [Lachnospiraceae bacterium]
MEEKKRKFLTQLEKFFKDDEDVEEVSLFTKEELGTPMDVLRALLTGYGPGMIDVLAEFSFLPIEGADEVWYFNTVITIMTNVPKDGASALAGAISRLNFYLPYGGFCLSPDGTMLTYKSVTALRTDHPEKKLYEDIELSADTALLVPENYTYLLIKVAEGSMLLSEFIDTLPE